jgi:hypothetical protein
MNCVYRINSFITYLVQLNMKNTIFALGTCRLMATMKHLHKQGKIDLANINHSWYAHNILEINQRLAVMAGKITIPKDLHALVVNQDSCPSGFDTLNGIYDFPDIGVIEISTLAYRAFDNVYLHSTSITKEKFKNAQSFIMSISTFEQELVTLLSYFKRLVLVCNIERDKTLTSLDPHRKELNQIIKSTAYKNHSISVFDPNKFLDDENVVKYLKDRDHFSPDFVRVLQVEYNSFLNKLV